MKIVFAVLITGLLVGCAVSNTMDGAYSASDKHIDDKLLSEEKAELRIFRKSSWLGKYGGVNVFLDNVKAPKISNASVQTLTLAPGEHNIYSRASFLDANPGCGFDFIAEKGELIYMSISPKVSGNLPILSILLNPLVCKYALEPVDAAYGEIQFTELQSQ